MIIYSCTLMAAGSVVVSRLYFCSCSPADVQAGCIIGAIILRIWIMIAGDVDIYLMSLNTWWFLPIVAVLLLVIHPLPSLVNIPETFEFCVGVLGFSSGFVWGTTMPTSFPYGQCSQDSSACNQIVRSVVG